MFGGGGGAGGFGFGGFGGLGAAPITVEYRLFFRAVHVLPVTLEQAYSGAEVDIRVLQGKRCGSCDGRCTVDGKKVPHHSNADSPWKACSTCDGTGTKQVDLDPSDDILLKSQYASTSVSIGMSCPGKFGSFVQKVKPTKLPCELCDGFGFCLPVDMRCIVCRGRGYSQHEVLDKVRIFYCIIGPLCIKCDNAVGMIIL